MVRSENKSRASQKKKERLELQRKMDARVCIVHAANSLKNPLDALPSFTMFNREGLEVALSTDRAMCLDAGTKDWALDLLKRNMKQMYEQSHWGWNEVNKRKEMFDDNAWYLLARRTGTGQLVGFSHFRYDMDYDDEVLYVYEIQLEPEVQHQGLGTFMMQVLEMLCFKADLRKIMLTVFKHNPKAVQFFKQVMRYECDETCPVDDVYEQFDYLILSKFNRRKLAIEDKC